MAPKAVSTNGTLPHLSSYAPQSNRCKETTMTWGKGALLWLIGIPLPIIILLALFWR